ncbi:MAG: alpha/beta hydrolase [Leptolyngbyaceae cyanobacterium RM2_2_4]|nr:alpha/beta hydrolase [Leptolyngbyaceae cyanobacterium RM2_2_4]
MSQESENMTVECCYTSEPLPFRWKNAEVSQIDQRWLGGIIRNAAPFSDWWTRTRAVQLAYVAEHGADAKVYAGLLNEAAIAETLHQELLIYCQLHNQFRDMAECQAKYPGFCREVDEEFVIKTLNSWKQKQFTQAISRNFEVYGDRQNPHVYLVVSTASVSLQVERRLPSTRRFRPLFNIDELAKIIQQSNVNTLTLRTHGYATPAKGFYDGFAEEADALEGTHTISAQHLYIGYHWPSEQPFLNLGLLKDLVSNVGILLKFVSSLFVISLVPSLVLAFLYDLVLPLQLRWYWTFPVIVFLLWLLAFGLLRAVVYQRDRYRAIHYGAPDLAEFFWRLDRVLKRLQAPAAPMEDSVDLPESVRTKVNLVGHSMGGLVVVNTLRVLSDRFGKDDRTTEQEKQMGECLDLGKLILASPDIPLELIQEGRNNYVRSAIRRCEQIYLMSSDRDIVLRYLSILSNWFTEPSIEMSGLRLGNVYIRRGNKPKEMLWIRNALLSRKAVEATSAYDLFESFNYLDCSRMVGVNAIALGLNPFTALPIDLGNILPYLLGKIDVHGGYFRTYTPTFKFLQFLMQNHNPSEAEILQALEQCDPREQILFLPQQPMS